MKGETKYTVYPAISQKTYSLIQSFNMISRVFSHLQSVIIREDCHCNGNDMLPEMFCAEVKNMDVPCNSQSVWIGWYSIIHRRMGLIAHIEVRKEIKL